MESKHIIWSDEVSALELQKDLPKVVRVEDGYYDDKDDTTLSNGDVLTLHSRQKKRWYKAVCKQGQEVHIPTSILAKVQTLPDEQPRIYHNIRELLQDGIEKVEWMHKAPWLNVEEGDVTQIQEVCQERTEMYVKMSFVNKQQDDISVRLDYNSAFRPVICETLWLGPGKEDQFDYPMKIKVIDDSLQVINNNPNESSELSTIADLGDIILLGYLEREVFIASIKDEKNSIIVMKIPSTLDINLREGVGMYDRAKYNLTTVCQMFDERACLEQLEVNDFESIRIGNKEAVVERIYEVPGIDLSESESEDEYHEYVDPAPPLPTRQGREPYRQPTNSDDDDDDDDDYEVYDDKNGKDDDDNARMEDQGGVETGSESESYDDVWNINLDPPEENQTGCCCFKNRYTINTNTSNPSQKQSETPREDVISSQPNRYVDERKFIKETPSNDMKDFEIPRVLNELSIDGVVECLRQLNMEKHIEAFKQNQIDGELLVTLDDKMLEELGIDNRFENQKLTKFINGWRPER